MLVWAGRLKLSDAPRRTRMRRRRSLGCIHQSSQSVRRIDTGTATWSSHIVSPEGFKKETAASWSGASWFKPCNKSHVSEAQSTRSFRFEATKARYNRAPCKGIEKWSLSHMHRLWAHILRLIMTASCCGISGNCFAKASCPLQQASVRSNSWTDRRRVRA